MITLRQSLYLIIYTGLFSVLGAITLVRGCRTLGIPPIPGSPFASPDLGTELQVPAGTRFMISGTNCTARTPHCAEIFPSTRYTQLRRHSPFAKIYLNMPHTIAASCTTNGTGFIASLDAVASSNYHPDLKGIDFMALATASASGRITTEAPTTGASNAIVAVDYDTRIMVFSVGVFSIADANALLDSVWCETDDGSTLQADVHHHE